MRLKPGIAVIDLCTLADLILTKYRSIKRHQEGAAGRFGCPGTDRRLVWSEIVNLGGGKSCQSAAERVSELTSVCPLPPDQAVPPAAPVLGAMIHALLLTTRTAHVIYERFYCSLTEPEKAELRAACDQAGLRTAPDNSESVGRFR